MQKAFCYLLFLLFAISTALSAQERNYTIAGKVSDDLGELAGVSIGVKGKLVSTVTDTQGRFSIRVSHGDWLMFSFIGYEPIELLITEENKNMDIQMKPSAHQIEEVVVTSMGTQRKISNLGAITTVNPDEFQVPTPSIANLLGGRVAGIFSMVSSGEPGKNLAEFWVRGIGTFGASSGALVLIDGLEGNINNIDPADVESFSVLKDASATAVYGVRGANGVVLVTTKRGQPGKLRVTGRANLSISQVRRLPKYLRSYDYANLVNEAFEVRNQDSMYDDIELQVIRDGLDTDLYPDVDWQEELINNLSFKQNYYVSAQGGSESASYFVSLAASNESAAYKAEKNNPYASNAGYNTYSIRLNLDMNLTPTTKVYFGTETFISQNVLPGLMNTDEIWYSQASITPILFPTMYSNEQFPISQNGTQSPYMIINHTGKTNVNKNTSLVTLALDQKLDFVTEGLDFRAQFAYNRSADFTEQRFTLPAQHRAIGRNSKGELLTQEIRQQRKDALYSSGESQWRKYHFESRINYDRVFNDVHRVGGLVYFYLSDDQSSNQRWNNENSGLTASFGQIPKRYMGISSRINYGFRDTYLIDFNFGYTGSENLKVGEQFGFFPSLSLGWIPSEYSWIKDNLPWLSLFKLRGSYGTVGNDRIGGSRFPYLSRVGESITYPWGSMYRAENIWVASTGAENLKWEIAKKANIGLDAEFFNKAFALTVDFFKDNRDGIFQTRVQIPDFVGLPNLPYGNVGEMVSWGTDGNFSYMHSFNDNMSFTVRGNYTYAHNKVLNFEKTYDRFPYQDRNNLPDGIWRGYQCLGFFKDEDDIRYSPKQSWGAVKPGDLKYKDINGDGKINSDDQVPLSLRSMFPQLSYGLGGEFRYKSLSVGFLLKGTGKVDYFRNNTGYIPFNAGEEGNILSRFKDPSTRWIPKEYAEAHGMDMSLAENPNAELPRLQYGHNSNNAQLSDFWKGDARYLRLQEVTVNYNLKHKFLQSIGVSSLDLQFVGNNLAVWDKVKDFDPEQADRVGRVYPIPAVYSFQVYIHF